VMVTGGCGFIGSHLVRRLAGQGVGPIVVVDSLRHGHSESLAGLDVEIVAHELGFAPARELERAMRGVEVVFHLAAEKHNQSSHEPLRIYRANVDGTHTLLDVAGRCGVRKIVFASSLYAYGRDRGAPFLESEAARPATPYGISKLAGEHMLEAWRGRFGGAAVALRYLFVYGPACAGAPLAPSLIATSFARIAAGEPPVLRGDGQQVFDYVFVDDVVDATLLAMEGDIDGEVFNVGSGEGIGVAALLQRMLRVSASSLTPISAPADATSGTSRVASIEKISRVLGWHPRTRLEDGLERVWRAHQSVIG